MLSGQSAPLAAHTAFTASTVDQIAEVTASRLAATIVETPRHHDSFESQANYFKLPQSQLWYCAYGTPLALRFPDGENLRLQVQLRGAAATRIGKQQISVTGTQACISSSGVEIDFAADFAQLVWLIPKKTLLQKLATMSGRPLRGELSFDAALDLRTPQAATLRQLLGCLIHTIDAMRGDASVIVLRELEQALAASFMAASDHNGRHLIDGPAPTAAPWQVHRAESYIEANWNRPITIEELAAASGTSARSLFRTFKQSRGCSPLEFARRLRLENARSLLANPETPTTVTDVAFACGFADLGRFSKEFARSFGEAPSALLKRKMAATRTAGSSIARSAA